MSKFNKFLSRIMSIGAVQRQSIVSLFWQIAFTAIGFLSTMYFTRTVGASVLGGYFLFIAYFNIINMMTDGGFGGAAIKRISEGKEQDAYFTAFFVIRSFFMVFIIVVLIVFQSYFADLKDAGVFLWLVVALITSLFYGSLISGIEGRAKMGISSTMKFINNFSRIIIQIIAVFLGLGIGGLTIGFVGGMIISSIIQLRFFDLNFIHFEWRHVKSLSTFSFWVFLISSGSIVFSSSDTIMIGYFLNYEDVGVYRIALQFATLAPFVATTLVPTLWPRVSRWGKTGEIESIERSLSHGLTYSLVLAVPMFLGGVVLGDKLLNYLYGPEFERGYATLIILFIVQLISIFQLFFTSYLSAIDHLKDIFKSTVVAVSANIVLNAILIPLIGIEGAAIATFITVGLNSIIPMWILSKIITIKIEYQSLINIMKASVAMSLFVCGYRMFIPLSNLGSTLIPIIIGAGMYISLILKYDKNIYEELRIIAVRMSLI